MLKKRSRLDERGSEMGGALIFSFGYRTDVSNRRHRPRLTSRQAIVLTLRHPRRAPLTNVYRQVGVYAETDVPCDWSAL